MADLLKYNIKPDSLPDEVVETVSTAAQISGKSTRTPLLMISFLKLPPEELPATFADILNIVGKSIMFQIGVGPNPLEAVLNFEC